MTFKVLIQALELFEEEWLYELGVDGCRDSLKRLINERVIQLGQLRQEYKSAMLLAAVDWHQIAKNSKMFSSVDIYSSNDIKSIVEYYLLEIIEGKSILNHSQKKMIEEQLILLLEDKKRWFDIEVVYQQLNNYINSVRRFHLYEHQSFFDLSLELKNKNPDKFLIADWIRLK